MPSLSPSPGPVFLVVTVSDAAARDTAVASAFEGVKKSLIGSKIAGKVNVLLDVPSVA